MLCGRCHERQATVFFTKIVGGEKSAYHLCEVCAEEQGQLFVSSSNGFPFNQLLSGLLNLESSPGYTAPSAAAAKCNVCGMSYAQFTKLGRFGCPHCYESFAARLEPLLRRIQSNSTHTGKIPARSGERVKLQKSLARLRRDLRQAVELEQFERAAEIRDEIRTLEPRIDE